MKIKVGQTKLNVKNFYPFRYPDGKLVVRFDVKQEDADFHVLYRLLHENQNSIEYYEKDEDENPTCIYYGYSDFTANYHHGIYHVEQITPSTIQSAVEALQAKLKEQESFLSQQAEVIQNQSAVMDTLTEGILEMSMEIYMDEEENIEAIKEDENE